MLILKSTSTVGEDGKSGTVAETAVVVSSFCSQQFDDDFSLTVLPQLSSLQTMFSKSPLLLMLLPTKGEGTRLPLLFIPVAFESVVAPFAALEKLMALVSFL
jgi:hypothetical protein